MLKDRNLNWMPSIEGYLDRNEDAFIVVGSAHLPGSWGLLALLEAEGYEVTPLPEPPRVEMEIKTRMLFHILCFPEPLVGPFN